MFYADPQPTVTWSKDGVAIATTKFITSSINNGSLDVITSVLMLGKVNKTDMAVYMCKAENTKGSQQHTINFGVECE